MKKKVFSMLALLVAATTGAWADDDPINLTYDAQTDKWTLASMPAYDVELQVEYYDEVTLTDGQAITALNTYVGQEMWVNYSRSFTNGITSTVCLPFAYTPKAGEKFYTFNGVSYNEGTQQWVADMTQEAGATLEANKPYLFLPSATGNVDFSGAYTIPNSLEPVPATSGDWTFCGTYTQLAYPTAFVSNYVYGFAGAAQTASGDQDAVVAGEFVRAGNGSTFPVMRCYLKRDSELQAIGHRAAAMPDRIVVRLHDADGHVTSIGGQLTVKDENAQCYTLDGRLVNGQPTQKGIYVKNGKKVVIK